MLETKQATVVGISTPFQHLYIVLDRDVGVDEVIRGGPSFFILDVSAGVPLTGSPDDRVDVFGNPVHRDSTTLDLGGRDPEDAWAIMTQHGNNIDSELFSYIPVDDTIFGFVARNSNSVAASVLNSVGIQISENMLPGGHEVSEYPGLSNTLGFGTSLRGTSNNDVVRGGAGNDSIYGDDGSDIIYGNQDSDLLFGDSGNDTLYGSQSNDTISSGDGDDLLYGNRENDTISGGVGNDTLYGGQNSDLVQGGEDTDLLFGNLGSDTIIGDSGNDILFGNDGHDRMYGGFGDDLIYGGPGRDTISAGPGNDTIAGGASLDSVYTGTGQDIILATGEESSTYFEIYEDFDPENDAYLVIGTIVGKFEEYGGVAVRYFGVRENHIFFYGAQLNDISINGNYVHYTEYDFL